ncbi:MBL fold metallo-hydrolase [soil metagenome]
MKILRRIGATLLWIVILLCLAITIVPQFLDRQYYRGPVTDHFDGQHFFNPDGEDTLAPPTGGSRSNFFFRYLTASDGRPVWPGHVTIHPVAPPARVDGNAMVVTWIGHASALIQTQGLNILTDPVWSDSAGPFGFGPRRVAAPGIVFDALPKIDIVLVSHNHYDHMDLPTLKRLWLRDRPRIITSLGNDAVLGADDIPSVALDWGGRLSVRPGIDVVVTRNHHWDSRWFTDRDRALWSSFVIRLPGGNIFFAGDTGFGDGKWVDDAAALGPVRLALIPIGAFRFVPGQMGIGSHIGPIDAVRIFHRLGASTAIPIHWGTFRLSFEAWDTPPRLLAATLACSGTANNRLDPIFAPAAIGRPVAIRPIQPVYAPPSAIALPPPDRAAVVKCLATPAVRGMR